MVYCEVQRIRLFGLEFGVAGGGGGGGRVSRALGAVKLTQLRCAGHPIISWRSSGWLLGLELFGFLYEP